MQNNTIAFTILKFPVLVRVQHNFTTVYSIFLRSPPKLGADILLFSLLSLLPPFNSLHFFLKGTCCSVSVLTDTDTLLGPSPSLRRSRGLLTGSLLSLSREYITGAAFAKGTGRAEDAERLLCVVRARNRNHFHQRNPFGRRRGGGRVYRPLEKKRGFCQDYVGGGEGPVRIGTKFPSSGLDLLAVAGGLTPPPLLLPFQPRKTLLGGGRWSEGGGGRFVCCRCRSSLKVP